MKGNDEVVADDGRLENGMRTSVIEGWICNKELLTERDCQAGRKEDLYMQGEGSQKMAGSRKCERVI